MNRDNALYLAWNHRDQRWCTFDYEKRQATSDALKLVDTLAGSGFLFMPLSVEIGIENRMYGCPIRKILSLRFGSINQLAPKPPVLSRTEFSELKIGDLYWLDRSGAVSRVEASTSKKEV